MTKEEIMALPKPRKKSKPDISAMCCNDGRTCFARKRAYDGVGPLICTILHEAYPVAGECPYCKPEREVTNDKYYPYNEKLWDHNIRRTLKRRNEQYADNAND